MLQPCLQCCQGAADPSARLPVEPPLIPSLPVETFALCFFRSRWRDSKPPGARFPLGLGSSLRKGRAGSGSPRAAVAPPAAPVAPAGTSPLWETEWVRAVLPIWGYSAVRVCGPPEPSRKEEQGGVGWVGSGGERPRLIRVCHPPQRVRKPWGPGTRSALLRGGGVGGVVALVKINEGGKQAAAGMREILRCGSFHPLPDLTGKSFPLHADTSGITQDCWGHRGHTRSWRSNPCSEEAQHTAASCNGGSSRAPFPAGRPGSARCTFISSIQRSPPGRCALSISPGSFASFQGVPCAPSSPRLNKPAAVAQCSARRRKWERIS